MRNARRKSRKLRWPAALRGERLESRCLLAAEPVITEFMAANDSTLLDQYGESSDWIELHNRGDAPANLNGWYLTDAAADLKGWRIPEVTLAPGEYRIVFASNRDQDDPLGELHTNFRLSASGEYLALVRPDLTIAHEFSPSFPQQLADVSYGFSTVTSETQVIAAGASAKVHIPTDNSLEANWIDPDFDDSSWTTGTTGIGYDIDGPETIVEAPAEIPGNVLWLDASDINGDYQDDNLVDGTPVSVWVDKSTGGEGTVAQDIASNQPRVKNNIVNGRPVVQLDGSDWLTGLPVLAGGDDTFTFVAVWQPHVATIQVVLEQSQTPLAAGTRGALLAVGSNYGFNGQNNDAHSLVPYAANEWRVTTMQLDGTPGNNVHVFDNGTEFVGSVNINTQNLGTSGLRVGSKLTNNAEAFDGDLAELVVYDRVISESERARLEGYLASKYSLTVVPPAGPLDPVVDFTPWIGTDVEAEMRGSNTSAYMRVAFEVPDPANVAALRLEMRLDDGAIAWINGTEVVAVNAPDNASWNSQATSLRPDSDAVQPLVIDIPVSPGLLRPGTNVLALQGLNISADSPDFLQLPELFLLDAGVVDLQTPRYFVTPTPGFPNGTGAEDLGPIVSNVTRRVPPLADTEDLLVTATVIPSFHAVANATLHYRVMFGNEATLPLRDDGTGDDALAGDRVYSARIPHTVSAPGEMIRWYVTATDSEGHDSRWPLFENPTSSAAYFGTIVADSAASSELPVLYWFVEDPQAARTDAGTRASLYFDGEFYDNFFVRRRGYSTLGWEKRKFKFDFNPGDHFRYDDAEQRVEEFNLQSHYREIGAVSYLRENMGFAWLNEAGVPSPTTFHLQLRQNGSFYGLYSFVEQIDDTFLDRHGFDPNGAMYKALQNGTLAPNPTPATYRKVTQKEQPWDDFVNLTDGLSGIGGDRFLYVWDHLDVAQIVNIMAAQTIMPNHDRLIKNYYMYLDPETKEWHRFPWDMDQPFAVGVKLSNDPWANVLFGDTEHVQEPCCSSWFNYVHDAILDNPVTREMYLRRLRTLMDQYLDAGTGYFENLIASFHDRIKDEADADNAVWGAGDIEAGVNAILNTTLPTRRAYLEADPLVPPSQAAVDLAIGAIEVNPASGNQDEEYIQIVNHGAAAVDISGWRLTDAVEMTFQAGTVIPGNGVLYVSPNVIAFRARASGPTGGQGLFVQGNYSGHLSNFGETIRLLDANGVQHTSMTYAGDPSPAQQFLRITEVMYNPLPPTAAESAAGFSDNEDFEYIELANTSATETLDLNGVRLTAGVSFAFTGSAVTSLAPGARVLVARNPAALESRYGPALNGIIAGSFANGSGLNNGGETLKLEDATNSTIVQFTYGTSEEGGWPTRADGNGSSLQIIDTAGNPAAAANWRPSSEISGSPGAAGDPARTGIVINEVLSHTDLPQVDAIELRNVSGGPLEITNYYLSDSNANHRAFEKFRIPASTILPAGGIAVFDEDEFNSGGGVDPNDFALSSLGDDVWLTVGDGQRATHFMDHFEFGAAANGVSFIRHVDSIGKVHATAQEGIPGTTLGATNNSFLVGGVVITEVHYHPDRANPSENYLDEFTELQNTTGESVPLYDAVHGNGWKLDGVGFFFPPDAVLAAGEVALVVSIDPQSFRAAYGIESHVQVFGPYPGSLANSGERLALQRPDRPNPGSPPVVPYIDVDVVDYRSQTPWPVDPDGAGRSLTRLAATAFGSDPRSWYGAEPTPGTVRTAAFVANRQIFYNHSVYDGDAGASPGDDAAIAVDKSALFPGQIASPANYSSYHRGLNGLIVDFANLADRANLTLANVDNYFAFHVGRDGTTWTDAPRPMELTVRTGAGQRGSDRVSLVWEAGAIANQWLRVSIPANEATGLAVPDLFYFGNAVGESAAAGGNAEVNAFDFAGARDHAGAAGVESRYDYDRSGQVDGADLAIARDGATTFRTALQLLDLSLPVPPPALLLQSRAFLNQPFVDAVFAEDEHRLAKTLGTPEFRLRGSAALWKYEPAHRLQGPTDGLETSIGSWQETLEKNLNEIALPSVHLGLQAKSPVN